MPEKKTLERARADKRAGKASSTQAGEFVKEQVDKVRAGKHGARSAKQAIAIGLSEARRAGVAVKSPKKGTASEATRKKAATDNAAGQHKSSAKKSTESTAKRARAATNALKREGSAGASPAALSKQTTGKAVLAGYGSPARRSDIESKEFRSRQVINGSDLAKLSLDSIELAAKQGHMAYRTVSVYPQVDQQINKAIELIATRQLPARQAFQQAQANSIAELKRSGVNL